MYIHIYLTQVVVGWIATFYEGHSSAYGRCINPAFVNWNGAIHQVDALNARVSPRRLELS